MGGFISNVGNILTYHLKGTSNSVMFSDNLILRKPIGLSSKSYGFMEAMLHRNIGSHQFNYDGFGTTIGMGANPYLNSEIDPWFALDEAKQRYDNYMSYMNDMYFHGSMLPPNFQSFGDTTIFNDYNSMLSEISRVGAIHHYDIDNITGARLFVADGSTNPNGYDDSRLGVINNFYLSASLRNSYDNMLLRNTSSYHKPSYGRKDEVIENSYSVTQGAYNKFGFKGEYGMNNGSFSLRENTVMSQNVYTDDVIVWSTADSYYGGRGDNERMGNILGIDIEDVNNHSSNQRKEWGFKNYPFGNFYSLTYSLGLISASGEKTKEFIAKSIYGIDLMAEANVSLDFNNGDIESLQKQSRKKYFASIGSRGTNYIDAMTSIDVEYESDVECNIIRLSFNDPGNDNLYTFNTYLVYEEAEGNKQAVKFSDGNGIIGSTGAIINQFRTYDGTINKKDIISYTNEQFQNNKIKTIIGRFHTDSYRSISDARTKRDLTSSAVSQYGMSRGRNLLKKDHQFNNNNGFHDPYCRTWTYHKQYSKYSDLIRPFNNENLSELNDLLTKTYQPNRERLTKLGVKDENGILQYFPKSKDITTCMFSIENLAWRDSQTIKDARDGKNNYTMGPNGGRIMWFPPYGLTFQESSKANWNASQFIGRGEKIYSYVDTERSGSLSFEMLIDHPSLLNAMHNVKSESIGDVDDVNSAEQQILRFFAGCEILSSQKKSTETETSKTVRGERTPIARSSTIENFTIEFDVYFPYGYSGTEDGVDWVKYLLSGIGCEVEDVDVYSNSGLTKFVSGGYEMESNKGLSYFDEWDKTWEEYPLAQYSTGKYLISKTSLYLKRTNGTTSKVENKYVNAKKVTNEKGKDVYWGYLIDKKISTENASSFSKAKHHLDNISYHLNTEIRKKERQNDAEGLKVSFAEFAVFMNSECCTEKKKKLISTEANQNLLKSLFSEYKVNKVDINGYDYLLNNLNNNDTVQQKRAKVVEKWLQTKSELKGDFYKTEWHYVGSVKNDVKDKPNSKKAKQNRKVNVVITLQKEIFDTDMDYYDNLNNTIIQTAKNTPVSGRTNLNSMAQLALSNIKEYEEKMEDIQKMTVGNDEVNMDGINYDEYKFFDTINKEDSFLRNKVLNKIKYFDPAYHSITPEGFNSRLTFLHQCTRQGPTNSMRDNGVNVKNLSFGQPPICVLRIGDFFNTKIIIDSVNIKYDDASWDLNDEGIGVMPMSAQVDISFVFLGGSELGGAVSVLQNAVSFNYYANTSVYDNHTTKIMNLNGLGNDEDAKQIQ